MLAAVRRLPGSGYWELAVACAVAECKVMAALSHRHDQWSLPSSAAAVPCIVAPEILRGIELKVSGDGVVCFFSAD